MTHSTPASPASFRELTKADLVELAPNAVVVIPLGSTEQHGSDLPTGTDAYIAEAIAARAGELAGHDVPVVIAPTLPVGVAAHHVALGGTLSITDRAYLDMLTDVGRSLAGSGFRRLLFLNGHGGNDPSVQAIGPRLVSELGLDIHVAAASYWTLCQQQLHDLMGPDVPAPGHAGAFETSLMLALRPDLVRTAAPNHGRGVRHSLADQGIDGALVMHPGIWSQSAGVTDSGFDADAQLGEKALDVIARSVAHLIVGFHASTC